MTFSSNETPTSFLTSFRTSYGPTMNAFASAMEAGGTNDLFAELAAVFSARNGSPDPERTTIPATSLRVTVAT